MNGYDIPQYLLIGLLAIYCIGNGIGVVRDMIFAHRVKRMVHEIRNKVACNGHLIPPDNIVPRAYNIASGYREYIFLEERNDTYGERLIFISKDCRHIWVMPWREPNECPDER